MAFGVEELRVLRRALALALQPSPVSAEDVQDCLRLAESLDEAMREGARMRAFLVADVARYRTALPGTAAGYLALLGEALRAGYRPVPDDLTALRALRGNPAAAALLDRCRKLAGREQRDRRDQQDGRDQQDARDEPGGRGVRARLAPRAGRSPTPLVLRAPASRTRLTALPGGLAADAREEPVRKPEKKPIEKPAPKPPAPAPAAPKPARPIPTPGEVFPRRKPAPPPANPSRQLVVAG
ncbi:hypothetical protein QQY66_27960 [Streptomyces sp. DG2A-72]|uniref:hypothetical protein n=1 Tax=Streptomyces sp. DG2A-72 TaxID=3051386 RepID=UPI00265C3124|nr:hypothetical protein [Streptomyces sp. DG2A-72]MDO0935319.1 hypothetical protein [Streptomyces sp. DG2A-72]